MAEFDYIYSKYYTLTISGGWNPCIQSGPSPYGNYPYVDSKTATAEQKKKRTGWINPSNLLQTANSLPNCTAYAIGRFNQLLGKNSCYYQFSGDAANYVKSAKAKYSDLPINYTKPIRGAIACWSGGSGAGHVGVVEEVVSDTRFRMTNSGWSFMKYYNFPVKWNEVNKVNGTWYYGSGYKFEGFIYPPGSISVQEPYTEDPRVVAAMGASKGGAFSEKQVEKHFEEKEVTVKVVKQAEYDGTLARTKTTSLLSYPALVESPFIIIDIGGYKFGTYHAPQVINGNTHVDFPNYVTSLDVVKVNGSVNQYKVSLQYQIRYGDDPNFIDKILSSVGYNTIKISYGDWQSPTFQYKEEEALITKVTSRIDFSASRITYTIDCTSNSLGLYASCVQFPPRTDKPSDVIKEVFRNEKYGLRSVFTGMSIDDLDRLIASDDQVVDLNAQQSIDPLSYINYLVSCMISNTNSKDSIILDSTYFLALHDDTYANEEGGPYFTVEKVSANNANIRSFDTYEIDVGYPSDNLVMSFNISNDNSWALIYNYNSSVTAQDYVYSIDNDGNIKKTYSPDITTSANKFITTPVQKNWWTQMTRFPISATVVIKGLIRPAMLLTKVKVNAMFYGQRHISSGLYFVTRQEDTVDGSGYRTTLTLQRYAGDDDYVTAVTQTIKSEAPVVEPFAVEEDDRKSWLDDKVDWTIKSRQDDLAKKIKDSGQTIYNVTSAEMENTLPTLGPGLLYSGD